MRFIREDSDEVEVRLISHSERARLSHERWLNRALERERIEILNPQGLRVVAGNA